MTAPGTLRVGSGEPLVMIHGFSSSPVVWRPVLGRLEPSFDILAVALTGHAGGPQLPAGTPASVSALVDGVEREMDECGFDSAHIAGNSLGGWAALELAQRGRARSVIALSPAGGWEPGSREEKRLKGLFSRNHALIARTRAYIPKLVTRPRLRRAMLGQAMSRADLLTPDEALKMALDVLDCTIYFDLMAAVLRDGPPASFDAVTSPVLLAWGTNDKILPEDRYAPRMRRLLPHARSMELGGLGHVPMGDDRELVARTIADFAAAAQSGPSQPGGAEEHSRGASTAAAAQPIG
ncbi:MAG TPA: alpha/beta hydrolase [Solirubrobacteraceae bacterium]|nr:alpha/beta hydrolase [Solirubrobacteraceae bacterium]